MLPDAAVAAAMVRMEASKLDKRRRSCSCRSFKASMRDLVSEPTRASSAASRRAPRPDRLDCGAFVLLLDPKVAALSGPYLPDLELALMPPLVT
jgi:hypothetical protein